MGTGSDSCVSQAIDDAIPSGSGDCTEQGQNSSLRGKTRPRSPSQALIFPLSFGFHTTRSNNLSFSFQIADAANPAANSATADASKRCRKK
jgi:hypothetical protein